MSLFEELKDLGVNIDEAVERFMGNEGLYEKMLKKFPDMMNKASVEPNFDCSECAEVIEKTHAIKGAAGNLSLTPLYEAYTKIVDLLRGNQPEQARIILKEIQPVQTQIIACIEKHM